MQRRQLLETAAWKLPADPSISAHPNRLSTQSAAGRRPLFHPISSPRNMTQTYQDGPALVQNQDSATLDSIDGKENMF